MNFIVSVNEAFFKPCITMLYSLSKCITQKSNVFFLYWSNEKKPINFENLPKFLLKKFNFFVLPIPPITVLNYKKEWPDIIFLKLLAPFYLPTFVKFYTFLDADLIFSKRFKSFISRLEDFKTTVFGCNDHIIMKNRALFKKLRDKLYLNVGFISFNRRDYIDRFKNKETLLKLLFLDLEKYNYPEQDFLNIYLDGYKSIDDNLVMSFPSMEKTKNKNASIYHFTGTIKPWSHNYYSLKYSLLWWKYGKRIYGVREAIVSYLRILFKKTFALCNTLKQKSNK